LISSRLKAEACAEAAHPHTAARRGNARGFTILFIFQNFIFGFLISSYHSIHTTEAAVEEGYSQKMKKPSPGKSRKKAFKSEFCFEEGPPTSSEHRGLIHLFCGEVPCSPLSGATGQISTTEPVS
jgi:hypothetical protein